MTELRVTNSDDVAERLASEAAERGTSAQGLAADLLSKHVPKARERSFPFVGMFDAAPGAISVAELERRLEDGEEDEFGKYSSSIRDCSSRRRSVPIPTTSVAPPWSRRQMCR